MEDIGIQLEMNFNGEGGNRFKERLDNGSFFTLFEISPPERQSRLSDAAARFADIEFLVSAQKDIPSALAFIDGNGSSPTANVVEFASALCKTSRDSHLVYLSGRDASLKDMLNSLSRCKAEGFRSVVPVSGESMPSENARQTRARLFTESVHLIKENSDSEFPLFMGAAVNPFKYTPSDSFSQHFKLIKKVNLGASFAVSQFGWDMLKLQELRWNLERRGVHIPSIARLMMLTPERAEDICSGRLPGVHISPDFQAVLRKETMHSLAQFESAQWRRIQLHAAGARLLGFSAIQVSGLSRAEHVQTALRRIAEAIAEFESFEEWRQAFNEHYSRMEMAPYPNRFYMFEGLFSKAHSDDEPRMHDAKIPPCPNSERFRHSLSKALFSRADKLPASERRITKRILTGCRSCSLCRLPLTFYICPETCPKGMANGPCGGTQADGSCELGSMECIHSKAVRIASWKKDFQPLEETYVPPAPKRR